MEYPGLDDAFLRYMQAPPENQRRIQSFYLPFFAACQGPVVDLACGHGEFIQLLLQHGVDALGVDSDPFCSAQVRQRGIHVVCSDVLDYLQQVKENSLGGVFSSHLIEHLPHQAVMELIRRSYRALEPGGIILLVTPNVRGLYPHLESFYMHFGHVRFYHPRLLGFFLDYFGFSDPRVGENPRTAYPLWHGVRWTDPDKAVASLRAHPIRYDPRLSSQRPGPIGRAIGSIKTLAVRLLVQPIVDRVVGELNQNLGELRRYVSQLNANVNATHRRLMALDRGVECYVYATKGETVLDLAPELVGERP